MLVFITRTASQSVARWASFFTTGFVAIFVVAILSGLSAPAQESPPPLVSPHARLMAARSIFIEHDGGRLPNDVIGDAFQGWGHYNVVGDPARADLIVSINAPLSDSGVSVGSAGGHGRPGSSPSSSTSLSSSNVTQIRLLILDAHDRVVLWSGNEQPKSSMKERERENYVVDASLRLFRRFRNTIEPETAP